MSPDAGGSPLMPLSPKDRVTQALRDAILKDADAFLTENDRAEAMLITLSFESRVRPERQVWIDTGNLVEAHAPRVLEVELEDVNDPTFWDHTVAEVEIALDHADEASELVQMWLRGATIDACRARCPSLRVVVPDAR
jgi:hypothetical protein